MKSLFANRWFWRVVGAIFAGLLLFFVGPLVAIGSWRPLGNMWVALFIALLPVVGVGLYWWWQRRKAAKANAALVDALAAPNADRAALDAKLGEALAMLRSTKVGRRGSYVYQLPWYAIIGPSGAGKTTALLNSGLGFPTAVAGEYRALRGQPNTPDCDWWFTDEAVLIDTAGRYVTQDVDAARDAEGWKGFLDLLKTHRPLQPLNGVLVAIPAPDFADARKMADHAQHIRARLAEIQQTLGQTLPIYLLVTKADLLAGFREYFARATDAESDQVFGSTAPGDGSDGAAVLAGFDALVASVSERVVDRMQNEGQLPLRGQIATFPSQLASLRKPIADLLAALGQTSRFDTAARVRGVYLTSGNQTGNPVDRILLNMGVAAMASAHGVGSGRSYFLKRLFSDLVFPEAGIANRNAGAEKRQRQVYIGGAIAAAAALVLAIGLWTWGYIRNKALIGTVYETAAAYSNAAGTSRGGTSTPDQDLAALGVLAKARGDMDKASDFGLGLGQGGRLEGQIGAIYGRDLQRRLTPMLARLAEDRIDADRAAPAALYDDLKSYLVLGGRGPKAEEALLAWVQPAWAARSQDADAQVQAGEVARHTRALLDGAFVPVSLDTARVDAARSILRSQPASVRVYGRLKSVALADGETWTARENAGPQPEVFFAPAGAFAPGAGVPQLFTRTGYDKVFVPMLSSGPKLLDEERWVVGDTGARAGMTPAEMSMLKQDLQRLYFDEFLTRWRDYMAGMQPRPVSSLAENIQRLRDAAGPLSPIAPLMRAIVVATDMTAGKGAVVPKMKMPKIPGGQFGKMASTAAGDAIAGGGAGDDPREAAVRAFEPLRLFVGKLGAPGPLDATLASMGQLADKLNMVAVLPGGGGETGSAASLEVKALVAQLDQSGANMPAPAGVVVKAVAGDANVALGGARKSQMGAALSGNFGQDCRNVLGRSFPLLAASSNDISLEQFGHFFSPQGAFAKFVTQELAGYVDTTKPDWVLLPNASEIGMTETGLQSFQAAQRVTRAFFAADPNAPRLVYQIEPVALAGAKLVTLKADGQSLTYDGKSGVPATFDWPGAGGASIEFAIDGAAPAVKSWVGVWGAFRMMKEAAVKAAGSPLAGAGSLTQGGARFDFRVRTFGGSNPFVVDPFVKVSCPV